MKRIIFLFLTITSFPSFIIASQELIHLLEQDPIEAMPLFLIDYKYSFYINQDGEQEEKNDERLLTLSPFALPDTLETELPQENTSPAEETTSQEKFKFECLETTRQGTICKKWYSKSSLYSHLKKHHFRSYDNNNQPEIRCCGQIKHFKWKTLIAKHCLLKEDKGCFNEKCSHAKNIIAGQVGHTLTLKVKDTP
ncbi:hypothetical protein K9K77_03195 [Candidatus Babeliales bacterium]|nr:hypothetical protein [Candidatus Babeliales bacterium]